MSITLTSSKGTATSEIFSSTFHTSLPIRTYVLRTRANYYHGLNTAISNTRLATFPQLTKHDFVIYSFLRRYTVKLSELNICVIENVEVTRASINVGVGLGTTMHSTARHTLFLLIAKHKFYMCSLSNNSPFQQSKFESKVLQNVRIIKVTRSAY